MNTEKAKEKEKAVFYYYHDNRYGYDFIHKRVESYYTEVWQSELNRSTKIFDIQYMRFDEEKIWNPFARKVIQDVFKYMKENKVKILYVENLDYLTYDAQSWNKVISVFAENDIRIYVGNANKFVTKAEIVLS